MLAIHPQIAEARFRCPDCGCQLSQPHDLIFQGQHVLADIVCTCCDETYYQIYPVGHGAVFPVAFTKSGKRAHYPEAAKHWMALPLIRSMVADFSVELEIEIIRRAPADSIILLNCLDDCWGHVFQKILNAQRHLEGSPSQGLVILIPENFLWLVPEGIAEVWVVKGKLSDLKKKVDNLNTFVKAQYTRFAQVFLSKANIQPDATKIEMERFAKIPKFDLSSFDKTPTVVTFLWREDRFWHRYAWEEFVFLASVKFGVSAFSKPYFLFRQWAKYLLLAKRIKKEFPKATFRVVGLGKRRGLSFAEDLRVLQPNERDEAEWCRIYASSHLVIGVHGSHMLLPTALAAGYIELLPRWKLDRFGEDIAQGYPDRRMQFLGRTLDGFASVKLVARNAVSMLKGYVHFAGLLANDGK